MEAHIVVVSEDEHKAAVRLHTLLDLRGNISSFISINTGKVHEVNIIDNLCYEVGALYLIDRGYTDFARLFTIDQGQEFLSFALNQISVLIEYNHSILTSLLAYVAINELH